MAFTRFKFTKLWTSQDDFATIETDESRVRSDLQFLHDESKNGLNSLMGELEAQTSAATLGALDPEKAASTVQAELDRAHKERHSHSNKDLLDTYAQTEDNLKDAVSRKHSHSNSSTLAAITEAFTTGLKTAYDRLVTLFTGITSVATTLGADHTSIPTSKAVNDAITASGGIPAGGGQGQILTKSSSGNYDMAWQDPAGHAKSHFPGAADPLFPSDIGAAVTKTFNATITTAWAANTGYGVQSISVPGILAEDTPVVDVVLSGTPATDVARLEAWARVDRIVTSADAIAVYYYKLQPQAAIPIQLKVVR